MVLTMKKSGVGWGLNPNLVSVLAPFALVKVGAEIGAELDNLTFAGFKFSSSAPISAPTSTKPNGARADTKVTLNTI